MTAKVLGVGGVFFKAKDPKKLGGWYAKHLGVSFEPGGGATFAPAAMPPGGMTVWSPFDAKTDYFSPSKKEFMFNLVVGDLDGALAALKRAKAKVLKTEDHDYGRFAWFVDPEGNKVELWQPKAPQDDSHARIPDELEALERQLLEPEFRASADAVGVLLDEDFTEVGASGRQYSKADVVKAVASEKPTQRDLTDFHARQLGADVWLATARVRSQGKWSLRSSIWKKAGGRWLLLYHQGTRA